MKDRLLICRPCRDFLKHNILKTVYIPASSQKICRRRIWLEGYDLATISHQAGRKKGMVSNMCTHINECISAFKKSIQQSRDSWFVEPLRIIRIKRTYHLNVIRKSKCLKAY